MELSDKLIGASESFLKKSFKSMDLSVRNMNALDREGINTIEDLLLFGMDNYAKLRNVGRRSSSALTNCILRVYEEYHKPGEQSANILISAAHGKNCRELLDVLLRALPKKRKDLFLEKLGYSTGADKTLKEVGIAHSITKERVRQITKGQLMVLKRTKAEYLSEIAERLDEALQLSGDVVSLDELSKKDFFSGLERNHLGFMVNIIVELSDERYRLAEKKFLTILSEDEIEDFPSLISEIIEDFEYPMPESHFYETLRKKLPPVSWDYVTLCLEKGNISIINGKVVSPGRFSLLRQALNVLKTAGTPLHFTEIADLCIKQYGSSKDKKKDIEQALHSRLGVSQKCILVGRGTFLLRALFKVPANMPEIVDTSTAILKEISEISDSKYILAKLKNKGISTGELNEYSLKSLLLEYPGFVGYLKFAIGLEEFDGICKQKPLAEQIYEILKAAKKPLHAKDIYEEVMKKRGFQKYAVDQILYKDPEFIKTKTSTFTVKENIDSYQLKYLHILEIAKQWLEFNKRPLSPSLVCQILKERGIKEVFPGLVDHVLRINKRFQRSMDGYYNFAEE
jgi:DNA-directed RNA polymerase delta subunit